MNKNLENEYKELMDSEVSKIDDDALWNRIEAALPEKEVKDNKDTNIKKFPTKKTKNNFTKVIPVIGVAAAACLLVILVLPNSRVFKALDTANSSPACETATNTMESSNSMIAEAESGSTVCEEASFDSIAENKEMLNGVEFNDSVSESPACVEEAAAFDERAEMSEFTIIERRGDYYTCILVSAVLNLEAGTEIYVISPDEELEIGETYFYDLEYDCEEDGKAVFIAVE